MTRFSSSLPIVSALGVALTLSACAQKAPLGAPPPPKSFAEALLYNGEGIETGRVTLTPEGDGLTGHVSVTGGLTQGPHGMHIHAVGECKPKDFASAGGHFNPTGKQHGLQNPMGSHAGDLPMIMADADGRGSSSFTVHADLDTLLDADGASFVIHAGLDDMKSDPAGNSGARVMCGVLYKKQM